MKTTIEISDHLLTRAKAVAKQRNLTLRELTEAGLSRILDEAPWERPHKTTPVTFPGKGLHPECREAAWETIREKAYEGRGG